METEGWAVVGLDGGLYVAHTGRPIVYAEREDAAGWLAAGYTIQPVRITTAVECVHTGDTSRMGYHRHKTGCGAWVKDRYPYCPFCGGKVRVE